MLNSFSGPSSAMPHESKRATEAIEIVRQYMFGSFAAQVLPSLPLLDLAVQSGVQQQLVRRLATHYGVEFPSQRVREVLQELVGIGPAGIAINLIKDVIAKSTSSKKLTREAGELIRESIREEAQEMVGRLASTAVPGARLVLGMSEMVEPLATLYAVGHVFILHFEAGGTVDSLDTCIAKEQFEREMQIGRKIVAIKMGKKEP